MSDKVTKSVVLYFKPATIDRPGGARCGACWKFILSGACCEVKGDISKEQVCGLYVHGKPFDKDPNFLLTQVSKEEAGYGDGDTHCGNCEYIKNPKASYSPCQIVEGMIEPLGCCNAHEPR